MLGIFLEKSSFPDKAKCDGPSALPLDLLEDFLIQIKSIDKITKALKYSTLGNFINIIIFKIFI